MLNYNEVAAYKEIYGPNSNMTKSKRYAPVSASRTPNLLATPGMKYTVAMKRKAYLQTWNDSSMQQMEPQLHPMLDKFLDQLGTQAGLQDSETWSSDIDMQAMCEPYGFDATMVATLGIDPEISSHPERRWMLEAASVAAWRASTVIITSYTIQWKHALITDES